MRVFVSGTQWGAFTVRAYDVPQLVYAFQQYYWERVQEPIKWSNVLAHTVTTQGEVAQKNVQIKAGKKTVVTYSLLPLLTSHPDPVHIQRLIGSLRYTAPALTFVSAYCGSATFAYPCPVCKTPMRALAHRSDIVLCCGEYRKATCQAKLVSVCTLPVTIEEGTHLCPKHGDRCGGYTEEI